ncbi:hypothetical protein B7P43_G09128 [Cryptotermes secundus]|uniref:Methyltransferase FkbM domain-containing protein n=1 Tax=Cryptotermes secundus TaxID=105785 RepID=A0A2J7Q3A7_9NEOP|nr:uncharacterized protein LOC111870105 [Cryptotermes secundus]XP_023717880.1 uncharacterized protein LOC111870105 [Cryptotermes secundus]XP_023717881.1 uncharacterized protein LOC111870105 [Cryptotermes secundus]XP_033609571.1 uncharacterized protein LOC111870105 [Cryptotermes secundus]PNF23080.1 hypothetical protein B7P43_G09128 [Cryptotermes secundus]PNF23081.1 hypothetical protein B7P43_G09128 [Cryptotermes secundus]
MHLRKKIVMLVVSLLFIFVVVHIHQSIVTDDDPYSIYKQKYYLDGLSHWYNYSGESDLNGPTVSMDNPKLITKIRKKFLLSPSLHIEPYNLSFPLLYDTSMGQSEMILSILGDQKEGFFVECGALDGETRSNTLHFERHLNWSGLLVEADPLNFAKMENKKRKAYLSPSCMSTKPYPIMVSFKQDFNVGKISDYPPGYKEFGYVDVQCFPLYSYLLALNRTTVDYFSLDVEGSELDVLRTVPFEKLDIRTMSVEFVHVKEGKNVLRKFVERKGYVLHSEVIRENNLANDFIFVKSSVDAEINSRLL